MYNDIHDGKHSLCLNANYCFAHRRYKEWDDPHGETPPYHYGTHYSSAMIVCSYLVRMEPFTQHFLRLQVCTEDLQKRRMTVLFLAHSRSYMCDN